VRDVDKEVRPGSNRAITRSTLFGGALAAIGLVAFFSTVSFTLAATVTNRPLIKEFNGSDTTAGHFVRAGHIAIDQASGAVYVTDQGEEPTGPIIDKFNLAGEAKIFSATGSSTLPLEIPGAGLVSWPVAVDNSSANPDRVYALGNGTLKAFSAAGNALWEASEGGGFGDCLGVDAEGHPWTGLRGPGLLEERANSGSPPARLGQISETSACPFAFDGAGNLYVEDSGTVAKYEGGEFSSIFDPFPPFYSPFSTGSITADQSIGGDIFVLHNGVVLEFDPNGDLVERFGEGLISGGSVAYDHALDRVYVAGGTKVMVFGPPEVVGTAPDLTINHTTSNSIHTAHVSGTINPDGLENTYYFEYKEGNEAAWTGANSKTAPEHIVPADNTTHGVAADLSGLEPFTQYQVRLVATNDETGAKNFSEVDRFRTGQPAVLTINPPSNPTAHTVDVSGTVDPKDTETTWRFQTSSSPECLTGKGFSDSPSHLIPANAGPTPVEETIIGLIPAQQYCVRIAASNSPGTTTSEIRQFTTVAAPPLAEGRGAAPKTQTSARINAFIDPENAATSYRFEFSEDGGASWITEPSHSLPAGSTTSVLVSEEIDGLQPATAYAFRVVAENAGGSAQSEAQSFTTLAAPPVSCPNEGVRSDRHTTYLGACRGIELVNEPDKGNQNVFSEVPPIGFSPAAWGGEELVWSVAGGAPAGTNGAGNLFLAGRTAEGWRSHSLIPPAAEQFGGGSLAYKLDAITPTLGTFVFGVRGSTALASPPAPTLVRIREGNQEVLKSYAGQSSPTWEKTVDVTDDGSHVLFIDAQSKQLEDVGAARLGPPEKGGETISIMPDELPNFCGLDVIDGTSFLNPTQPDYQPGYHWIDTSDASRVYFLAKPNVGEPGAGACGSESLRLYERDREANGGSGETIEIDRGKATLLRVTPDGRHAYFATASALAPDDANGGADVYRWDEEAISGQHYACLTCLAGGADLQGNGEGFAGVLVSDDFSHVYFLSKNQLVQGQGRQGKLNLYALSAGQVHFVSTVEANVLPPGEERPLLSTDGNVLLFRADASHGLTRDAVASECASPRNEGPGPCEELYRYDDRDRSVECLSCDHKGTTTNSFGSPYLGPGFDDRLSADGSTVAFATSQALLPTDVNGGTDIYEWRNGALHLVTDGVNAYRSGGSAPRVFAVDHDGSNIFFAVVPPGGSLTGFERDSVSNVYDARIGGGFMPPPQVTRCEGESCQGSLRPPPMVVNPASSNFRGRGNLVRGGSSKSRCGKTAKRGRRRCVKRHGKKYHHPHSPRHHPSGRSKRGSRR